MNYMNPPEKIHTVTLQRENTYHGRINGKFFKWVNKQQYITNVGLKKEDTIAVLSNKLNL